MTTWNDVESAAPDLARRVRERFDATLHKAMATLRRDGSPRISGTEVVFADGDAKLAGVAVEVTDIHQIRRAWPDWEEQEHMASARAHAFRIEVNEVVLTTVEDDQLMITSWSKEAGLQTIRR